MGVGPGLRAALWLALGAASQGAAAAPKDPCRNESKLFCPGRQGRALKSCLQARRDGASRACKGWLDGAPAPAPEAHAPETPAPGLSVEEHVDTYAVDGTDAQELGAQLDRLGPFDPVLRRHVAAKTKDDIHWSFKTKPMAGGCAVDAAQVAVSVRQDFPEWQTPEGAGTALAAEWRRFMAALKAHEDGHKEIALKTALAILEALKGLSPQPDCRAVDQAAAVSAEAWFAREKQQNLDYDKETRHGATQGAVFR